MDSFGALDNFSAADRKYIDVAFQHAREALKRQEVPVGCIFVRDDRILSVGSNTVNLTKNATRHAEMNCIDDIVDYTKVNNLNTSDFFEEIRVYVTVEPCIMCMTALYDLKVKEIVYSCNNDRFGGQTVYDVRSVYKSVPTLIKSGYRADDAMDLLKEFYKGTNPNAPSSKAKKK